MTLEELQAEFPLGSRWRNPNGTDRRRPRVVGYDPENHSCQVVCADDADHGHLDRWSVDWFRKRAERIPDLPDASPEVWVNLYATDTCALHLSRSGADRHAVSGRVAIARYVLAEVTEP